MSGERKGFAYLKAKYGNSETSLMPGYITAQGARDLVALYAAKQDIQPFLDVIYAMVRERAKLGYTSGVFAGSEDPKLPTEKQQKAICRVLEQNGYIVVINFSDQLVISWD